MVNKEKLAALLSEARSIQSEQYNLIAARRNPNRFGDLERRLVVIWAQVDALRAEM